MSSVADWIDQFDAPLLHSSSPEESRFYVRVARRVRAVLRSNRWDTLYASVDGCFPTETRKVVLALNLVPPPARTADAEFISRGHVLDSEWFFDRQTACRLAARLAELARPNGCVLLLGAPSVVDPLLDLGCRVVLVDRSDHGLRQFIRDPSHPSFDFRRSDIHRLSEMPLDGQFGAVFLDPPWYTADYLAWLSIAVRHVSIGGFIGLSLFPRLTRPQASDERSELVRMLGAVGEVRVRRRELSYLIPEFEHAALVAENLTLDRPWRHGDLVTLQVRSHDWRSPSPTIDGYLRRDAWHEFIHSGQFIKLRLSQQPDEVALSSLTIRPAGGMSSFQLRSVSLREFENLPSDVAVWTSRNRLAAVSSPVSLAFVFQELSRGNSHVLDALPADTWRSLRDLLHGNA